MIFNQEKRNHSNQNDVDSEFDNIFRQLHQFFTYSKDRAPHSKDQGIFWAHKNGAEIDLYIRDLQSGTWRKETFT